MKNPVLISLFLSSFFGGFAQQGVQFEQNLNWQGILKKAKAENKYFFADCFATWCTPCKYMADSVFTRYELAEYLNMHFVNKEMIAELEVLKKPEP